MCTFQKLAFTEHGYVVSCVDCGYYQLAFGTTMLTINSDAFAHLLQTVLLKIKDIAENNVQRFSDETKNIIITTPSNQCCLILSKNELHSFYEILDNADNECKALSLLKLFEKNE